MQTRLIRSFPDHGKTDPSGRLRRFALAAAIAGAAFGTTGFATADDELQLVAPSNAQTVTKSADAEWVMRPPSAEDLPSEPSKSDESPVAANTPPVDAAPMAAAPPASVAAGGSGAAGQVGTEGKSTETQTAPTASPIGATIDASPASGPLSRFRSQHKLPTFKRKANSNPSNSDVPPLPPPGEEILDQSVPAAEQPHAWVGDGWQDRGDVNPSVEGSGRDVSIESPTAAADQQGAILASPSTPQTASPAPAQLDADAFSAPPAAPDGFRPQPQEGNWVARDAINRIQPLRDPVRHSAASPGQNAPAAQARTGAMNDPNNAFLAAENNPADEDTSDAATEAVAVPSAASKHSSTPADPPADDATPAPAAKQTQAAAVEATPDREIQFAPPESPRSMSLGEASANAGDPPSTRKDDANQVSDDLLNSLNQRVRSTPKSTDLKRSEGTPSTPATEPTAQPTTKASQQIRPKSDSGSQSRTTKANPASTKSAVTTKSATVAKLDKTPTTEPTTKPKNDPSASASVGDLSPQTDPMLDYTGRPAEPVQPTRGVANMRRGIERTLQYFYERPEVADGRSNWGMMHQMMVFGADTKVRVGRNRYSAIAWIAGNNNCRGQRLLTHDAKGIHAKSGVGLQGHQGQFLAVLGMCNVPVDYPLHAGKMKYDVAALIEAEKAACKQGEELTFTLIGLSHYLDTDSVWVADDGTQWDFERLIAEELKQPIVGAACGGTHRLMGYSHALRKRRAEGKPITGHWKRAETYINDFINYAFSLQNRDGSMSTKWFEGREDNGDVDRKVQTTGHIVEWLLTTVPDSQLQDRRLVAAVNFLYRSMGSDPSHDWSIGPKGHALRSLAMYHHRVFRAGSPWITDSVARSASQHRTR